MLMTLLAQYKDMFLGLREESRSHREQIRVIRAFSRNSAVPQFPARHLDQRTYTRT